MILDMRNIQYTDAFIQLKNALNVTDLNEEVLVFVDSHEHEKCMAIKSFAEILLECKTLVIETGEYYIVQIMYQQSGDTATKKIEAAA